ncbi:MAG TPA: hypothetical protein VJ742_12970 [Nitrososphaera sp.]|nr:hypothetical protein [Nitrososphaera sp.]
MGWIEENPDPPDNKWMEGLYYPISQGFYNMLLEAGIITSEGKLVAVEKALEETQEESETQVNKPEVRYVKDIEFHLRYWEEGMVLGFKTPEGLVEIPRDKYSQVLASNGFMYSVTPHTHYPVVIL